MDTSPGLSPHGRPADFLIPPPPDMVARLARASGSSPSDVAALVAEDVGLAVRLLRFAAGRSAAGAQWPANVEEAAERLGAASARLIVQAFCMVEAFRSADRAPPWAPRAWTRSLLTGLIARRLAPAAAHTERLVAGLLCDVGCWILDRAFPSYYPAIVEQSGGAPGQLADAERRTLPITHPEVGRMVFLVWQMPGHLAEAVAAHHEAACLPTHEPAYRTAAAVEVASELAALALDGVARESGSRLADAVATHAKPGGWNVAALATPLAHEFEHLATLLNLPVADNLEPAQARLAAWVAAQGRNC
jgi:HD-like signal output (HDOD) protein